MKTKGARNKTRRIVINHNGYATVFEPKHPMAMKNGYVLVHRMMAYDAGMLTNRIMEINHINGDKLDNRLDNFEVLNDFATRVLECSQIHNGWHGQKLTKTAIKQAVYTALVEQMPEKRELDVEQGVSRYHPNGKDMWGNHYADLVNGRTEAHNAAIDGCRAVLSAVLGIGEVE